MNKYRSIKSVLFIGRFFVTIPVILIMILTPILSLLVVINYLGTSYVTVAIIVGAILSQFTGWIWWSFTIPIWRVWAYSNTRKEDWQKLTDKAIQGLLIWPENHKYEKTEIRTSKQKEFIQEVYKYLKENNIESNT